MTGLVYDLYWLFKYANFTAINLMCMLNCNQTVGNYGQRCLGQVSPHLDSARLQVHITCLVLCLVLYFILVIEYDGYVYGYIYGYVYGHVMVWPSRFSSESSVPAIKVVIKNMTCDYIVMINLF